MKLYRTKSGIVIEENGRYYSLDRSFDSLVCEDDLYGYLSDIACRKNPIGNLDLSTLCAPIGSQEVWAAGVTYYRSRDARIEESKNAGGGDFYDRVYSAERPELFFKSMPQKVVGPLGSVRIRRDASWSVPEPELTLLVSPKTEIVGYTIGNDMSSRDIEGANPLYLPQAKVYDESCSLGPCVLVQREPIAESTKIEMEILRGGISEFRGATSLAELKRSPEVLVEYLFRDHSFPHGCFLLTGTGIVPPDSFTLRNNDEVRISIEGIGVLVNTVGGAEIGTPPPPSSRGYFSLFCWRYVGLGGVRYSFYWGYGQDILSKGDRDQGAGIRARKMQKPRLWPGLFFASI